ncbi:LysE family translocator [Phaeobacter inhibens]|uniref:LysE family translocator n=1 Tax=Phaeobacter inhibens TaxID=221822 RepID=UPI000C99B915|nr:LysE family translocator [Phaeobacter inhibens]AUQ63669.1 putative homoserine/homoserine lactone efflux protein [Phaeobacter inhibens]AUQ83574.1 putative homoserine/homoserine lactone efflux protein [Phaeobacter inhibens]AUQ91381.1 putative homoserine/homoserine lactone efflux protein [Phaeobacter inhibens]MDO6756787.1 LysE family translocator [Phaeobacter inhibens]
MTLDMVLALVLFLFPLAYSPGPGNLFFAANGARFGFRATLPATTGYHTATAAVTLLIGSGALAAQAVAQEVFIWLKMAGAGYVLWIAWGMWRAGGLQAELQARPARFRDGVLLLLLNPKAYVIIAVMFSQFLAPADPARIADDAAAHLSSGQLGLVTIITLIFTLNNLVAFSIWTWIGEGLARQIFRDDRARQMNRGFALLLVVVGLWMLLI